MNLHTCNYYCEKPACIKAQRDEMRDALFDQQTIADLQQKLAASEPVAWAYIHGGQLEEMGWGLPPESVGNEATLLYAAPQQKLAASEPVAWYDLDQMTVYTPVKPTIPGTWTPLYAAPPRTFDDGLEAAAKEAAMREDAERYRWFRLQGLWDSEHFPWPDGFEYPEGISEAEMLDAAIDAVRKVT